MKIKIIRRRGELEVHIEDAEGKNLICKEVPKEEEVDEVERERGTYESASAEVIVLKSGKTTYAVVLEITGAVYTIKDDLKRLGARFDYKGNRKWCIPTLDFNEYDWLTLKDRIERLEIHWRPENNELIFRSFLGKSH